MFRVPRYRSDGLRRQWMQKVGSDAISAPKISRPAQYRAAPRCSMLRYRLTDSSANINLHGKSLSESL
jgi:hypothetical protein